MKYTLTMGPLRIWCEQQGIFLDAPTLVCVDGQPRYALLSPETNYILHHLKQYNFFTDAFPRLSKKCNDYKTYMVLSDDPPTVCNCFFSVKDKCISNKFSYSR
jgi:hypothetical protein